MPLREFVAHPIAAELLHNGQALQVLGLTNYSHWPHAGALRGCLIADGESGEDGGGEGGGGVAAALLQRAKELLRAFAHVGTTEALPDSVEAAAAALGMDLSDLAYAAGEARLRGGGGG
jgi:hypothetical protein